MFGGTEPELERERERELRGQLLLLR
jgi:hypothetical protein